MTSHILHSKTSSITAIVFGAVVGMWSSSALAQCPGSDFLAGGAAAQARSFTNVNPDPDELLAFIGTGCTTSMFGTPAPTGCAVDTGAPIIALVAQFAASGDNTTGAGCVFNCQGGTCRVRGADALPVELLQFSAE